MDYTILGTFMLVVIGLFIIPGPAVLLILTRTVQGGRKTGILAGLGVACGDFVHTMFAALGLSAILMTSATAFSLVKYVGAAYLIYLGIRAFMEKPSDPSLPKVPDVSPNKVFFQSILIEVMNPKTALFFLAFLPQFVRPENGSLTWQLIGLGLIFVVMSVIYTVSIVLLIRPLGRLVKRLTWLRRWQGKIVGTIFISLGLTLAMQER